MIFFREFLAFLTAASAFTSGVEAGRLPPPRNLSYHWLDMFTVTVSWNMPSGLPDNCKIAYVYQEVSSNEWTRTTSRNFTFNCLEGNHSSGHWNLIVRTASKLNQSDCAIEMSEPATVTVKPPKPLVQLVENLSCLLHENKINCSWIPIGQSQNLTISYRRCGREIKPLEVCDQIYRRGNRNGCILNIFDYDICIILQADAGWSIIRPSLVLPTPELKVTQEGDNLKLSWNEVHINTCCKYQYTINYEYCHKTNNSTIFPREEPFEIPYHPQCEYKFRAKVETAPNCPSLMSKWSEILTYGKTKPYHTLTVMAVSIPIILSFSILLLCFCLRRHRAIIFPVIPDPSSILKEMMINGNREAKILENLYKPVPEPPDLCRLAPISEISTLQEGHDV